ncbi:MAG: V-type ATP synthase subunit E [Lachnospiraceae bacterium]|nr:V-type ATP synthase subunit E [Lachnospiraceae bacterium]
MNGLDEIIRQIGEEAEKTAEARVSEAREKADSIIKDAEAECSALKTEAKSRDERSEGINRDRIASAVDMEKRTALLNARQELISGVLEKAYEKVAGLDVNAYFSLMEKLMGAYVQEGEGKAGFSAEDLERMPDSFKKFVSSLSGKPGYSVSIDEKPADIENGFILSYGGIEENCTLRAIFDDRHDLLSDIARKVLFTGDTE